MVKSPLISFDTFGAARPSQRSPLEASQQSGKTNKKHTQIIIQYKIVVFLSETFVDLKYTKLSWTPISLRLASPLANLSWPSWQQPLAPKQNSFNAIQHWISCTRVLLASQTPFFLKPFAICGVFMKASTLLDAMSWYSSKVPVDAPSKFLNAKFHQCTFSGLTLILAGDLYQERMVTKFVLKVVFLYYNPPNTTQELQFQISWTKIHCG